MIGRTYDGGAVMVIGHIHGRVGRGAARDRTGDVRARRGRLGPFPMKVVVSMPEPGRLVHSWWYAMPGEEPVERDVAEVDLAT